MQTPTNYPNATAPVPMAPTVNSISPNTLGAVAAAAGALASPYSKIAIELAKKAEKATKDRQRRQEKKKQQDALKALDKQTVVRPAATPAAAREQQAPRGELMALDNSRAVAADAIHAPPVESGGMPAQSQSRKMLHDCKEQARKLSTELQSMQSMHKDMEQWHEMLKSLMEKHTEFALRFDELETTLSKAVDAQGVGAAGLAQNSVSAPGKAATADACLTTSSGAKAASDAKIRETKKMVSDIFTDISMVFRIKYSNYPGDVSIHTQHQHVRAYHRKFLSEDMQKLTAQDPNNTNMTWRSVFWLSLLYKFDDQVNKYMAQNPPQYEIKTEKQKIEKRADACKSIFIAATQGFESKWDIKGSPGGKEDTFEKEIQHISSAFDRLGIACDASRIERPVAAETPSRKRKHASVDGDGGQAREKDGFDEQPAQNVKREENSNGEVTEEDESDHDIVCLSP